VIPFRLLLAVLLLTVAETGRAELPDPQERATAPIDRVAGHDRIYHSSILEQDRPISILLPVDYHIDNVRWLLNIPSEFEHKKKATIAANSVS